MVTLQELKAIEIAKEDILYEQYGIILALDNSTNTVILNYKDSKGHYIGLERLPLTGTNMKLISEIVKLLIPDTFKPESLLVESTNIDPDIVRTRMRESISWMEDQVAREQRAEELRNLNRVTPQEPYSYPRSSTTVWDKTPIVITPPTMFKRWLDPGILSKLEKALLKSKCNSINGININYQIGE